ncbi:GlsB/YeaQ/YmgE family stress response membrane protein [Embleya sp. NPDC055664]
MGIIAWIILGLVAGIIAKMLVPGRDPGGFVVTIVIGIVGALLGGYLAVHLFHVHGTQGFFNLSTWVSAIAGAALLLVGYRLFEGQRGGTGRRTGSRRPHRSRARR